MVERDRGRSTKKNSCEKIHTQLVAQKKGLAYGKNIPAREMLTKKISCSTKFHPRPPQ